jgi:hypothetical protein
MGEHVAGLGFYRNRGTAATCSEVLRSRKATPIDRIHALTFLALLATSSRVATARDFLDDDNGLLHAWVHLEMVRENPEGIPPALVRGMRQYVLAVVGEIERAIPGYPVARRRR